MFSRLQVALLLGCVLLVGGCFVAIGLWPYLRSARLDNSSPPPPVSQTPLTRSSSLPARYFQLSVKGNGTLRRPQGDENGAAELELRYTHEKSVDGIILTFYSAALKTYQNGQLQYGFDLNRDRLIEQTAENSSEIPYEAASLLQQEKLRSAFATNFCKVLLDGNQNETGREMLSPLGRSVINEGLLDTARLVHGPYCLGLNNWKSDRRVAINGGMVLECAMHYEKPRGGNQILVTGSAASNSLTNDPRGIVLKNISCKLSGTERFDENTWEYTSADLTLNYRFDVFDKDALSGTLLGEMVISLKEVAR